MAKENLNKRKLDLFDTNKIDNAWDIRGGDKQQNRTRYDKIVISNGEHIRKQAPDVFTWGDFAGATFDDTHQGRKGDMCRDICAMD